VCSSTMRLSSVCGLHGDEAKQVWLRKNLFGKVWSSDCMPQWKIWSNGMLRWEIWSDVAYQYRKYVRMDPCVRWKLWRMRNRIRRRCSMGNMIRWRVTVVEMWLNDMTVCMGYAIRWSDARVSMGNMVGSLATIHGMWLDDRMACTSMGNMTG
jgi:hypothetical protein